ncbi:MAG: FAD-dependent oxidoreductase [Alphaproteobacteria bacterium]|nr:FAD-dependent oxidoreductase [Alphaproteobacteria bacterium]
MDFHGDGHQRASQRIAVVGTGIAGLSAAWLLSRHHEVTVYEAAARIGGHSHTVVTPEGIAVDMGFIVYNEANYPNLTALFAHLGVATLASDMSFAVSLDGGGLEYNGTDIPGLFAQRRNLIRPRFIRMVRDILRFYRSAPAHVAELWETMEPLGTYLDRHGYSADFQHDHLLPMAAAIWSTPCAEMRAYPAAAFLRFCANHGLLQVNDRPQWRTVAGGSREYVRRLAAPLAGRILTGRPVRAILRDAAGAEVHDASGECRRFDQVILATHAHDALAVLPDADRAEQALLGAFRPSMNRAVLHSDRSLMPRRERVWASWNYSGRSEAGADTRLPCVTYWMNHLQSLPGPPLFMTLNPSRDPAPGSVIHETGFNHPAFDATALRAQRELWTLQGVRRTWFAGAWFGAGFHEDGLQAGLAVAEAIGGVRRPWSVAGESGRIHLPPAHHRSVAEAVA